MAPTTFKGLAAFLVTIISALTALAVGIGVLYFLWGAATSIFDAGSAKSWEKFKNQFVVGIFVLFVMFSIWGILSLLGNSLFGTNNFNSL